jgi:hypothetical protein
MKLRYLFSVSKISAITICISVCASLAFSGGGNLFVFYNRHDIFMDFYNTLQTSRVNTAFTTYGNIYPPFLLLLMRLIFYPFASYSDAFQLRDSNPLISFLFIILFLLSIVAVVSIPYLASLSFRRKFCIFLLVILFPPIFSQFDRLNTLIIAFCVLVFCALMAAYGNSRSREDCKGVERYLSNSFICNVYFPGQWLLLGFVLSSYIKQYFIISVVIYILVGHSKLLHKTLALMLYLSSYILVNQLPFWGGYFSGSILDAPKNILSFSNYTQSAKAFNIYSIDIPHIFSDYLLSRDYRAFDFESLSFRVLSFLLIVIFSSACAFLASCFWVLLSRLVERHQQHSFSETSPTSVHSIFTFNCMRAQLSLLPCILLSYVSNSVGTGVLLFIVPYGMLYFFCFSSKAPSDFDVRRLLAVYAAILLLSAVPFSLVYSSSNIYLHFFLLASRSIVALLCAILLSMLTLPTRVPLYRFDKPRFFGA